MKKDVALCSALFNDIWKTCFTCRNKKLYLPIGIGQHMDHLILFQVGVWIWQNAEKDSKLFFYEEVPYVYIPHALKYRFQLLGVNIASETSKNTFIHDNSIIKEILEIFETIVSLPTLNMKNYFFKSILFVSLLFFKLFLNIFKKSLAESSDRLNLQPEIIDVTPSIENKLDAINMYTFKTTSTFWNNATLIESFERYSRVIGGTKDQFLERYWKIN